jgi:hypothetical protein
MLGSIKCREREREREDGEEHRSSLTLLCFGAGGESIPF